MSSSPSRQGAESPLSSSPPPPGAFRMFARRKSKSSSLLSVTPEPGSSPSPATVLPNSREEDSGMRRLLSNGANGRNRLSDDYSRSRASVSSSNPNSSSLRSAIAINGVEGNHSPSPVGGVSNSSAFSNKRLSLAADSEPRRLSRLSTPPMAVAPQSSRNLSAMNGSRSDNTKRHRHSKSDPQASKNGCLIQ